MLDFNNLPAKDKIFYKDDSVVIYCADNREILPLLSGVSAIVTDPPYELGFMGKSWDKTGIAYDLNVWQGCLNALLSGGHLLAFSGTRTYHRMACAIEDVGFDIRDMVEWMYGSGFPKSLDIGKAIDKMQGNERVEFESENIRPNSERGNGLAHGIYGKVWKDTKGNSEFEGWGTALKPAHEPICLARKPLSEKTVASNVLKYGTGGLNIDGCRIESGQEYADTARVNDHRFGGVSTFPSEKLKAGFVPSTGRFPANLIHDGSEEVVAMFPNPHGAGVARNAGTAKQDNAGSMFLGNSGSPNNGIRFGDSGSAARFFYCPKASRSERDRGCEDMPAVDNPSEYGLGAVEGNPRKPRECTGIEKIRNTHPTVKPIALMSYLIKLITPPNGIILDPFCGSGSTLVAAKQLGYKAIGIELDEKPCEISKARVMQLEIPKEDVKQEGLL